MSVEAVLPEQLAMLVHRYREALAPDFGCRASASQEWEALPQGERNRMVAATRLALLDIRSARLQKSYGDLPGSAEPSGGTEGKECGC